MTTCSDCRAMKVLLAFERELYKTDSQRTLDALQAAIKSQPPEDNMTTPGSKPEDRYTTTCIHPDCKALIHYTSSDKRIPLYCAKHMKDREHRGYKEVK